MRQLIIKVPSGNREAVESAIEKFKGKNTITIPDEDHDVFITFLPNRSVNDVLEEIDHIQNTEISLIPRGVITLYPPQSEAPEQVADVQPKSSLEIYLGGIQSVGSIFALLGYSFTAGIIVWVGLYTTTVYLLVAAMLIAPFAGPAMNAALATAAGKWPLLRSSLKRYAMAILTGILASFILSVAFNLQVLTPLMVEISQVSEVAILLPLIAGFGGAVNICQSERDSLVSGAAVGILVAASLAPPVGLIGAGIYLMDSQVILSSVFRVVLQLLGIHLAAALVFYFYGNVSTQGIRFVKGNKNVQRISTAVVVLAIGGMMVWQFNKTPFLRKASINTEFTEALTQELQKIPQIQIVNNDVQFTNRKYKGKTVVNFQATVLSSDLNLPDDSVKTKVLNHLKSTLQFPEENVYSVFLVNVVED